MRVAGAVFGNTWAAAASLARYNFSGVTMSKRRRARQAQKKLDKKRARARRVPVLVAAPVVPCFAPDPLEAAAAILDLVAEDLMNAHQILDDVSNIGVWSKSDDCSDNRQRRKGLREADSRVSRARRRLTDLETTEPELQRDFALLDADIGAVVADLEPLPDTVSDIMDKNPALDVSIYDAMARIDALRERSLGMSSEYTRRAQLARQQ